MFTGSVKSICYKEYVHWEKKSTLLENKETGMGLQFGISGRLPIAVKQVKFAARGKVIIDIWDVGRCKFVNAF